MSSTSKSTLRPKTAGRLRASKPLHRRSARLRAIAIASLVLLAPLAYGTPISGFAGSQPNFQSAASGSAGDHGVADKRGGATYNYPITVPPGRRVAPSLALSYSSGAPLRGGIAAGWNIAGFPTIKLDRKTQPGERAYVASLSGASGKLVEVPDSATYGGTTYRTQFDSNFVRFERVTTAHAAFDGGTGWVALAPSGLRYYFYDTDSDNVSHWHLSKVVDSFGNTARYTYGKRADNPFTAPDRFVEIWPTRIEYTSNAAAGLYAHAKVEFNYALREVCPGSSVPKGASATFVGEPANITDVNAGDAHPYYEGARRLLSITTWVTDAQSSSPSWRQVRGVELSYDEQALAACNTSAGAPVRYLTSIEETGWNQAGDPTTAPPVTFSYGPKVLGGDAPLGPTATLATHGRPDSWGTENGAQGTLLDLDGDGIKDRVTVVVGNNTNGRQVCQMRWWKGIYGGGYDSAESPKWNLPTASWDQGTVGDGEFCTINGQVTMFENLPPPSSCGDLETSIGSYLSYTFRDTDSDGLLDLIVTIYRSRYNVLCDVNISGTACAPNGEPYDLLRDCFPSYRNPEETSLGSEMFVSRVYKNYGHAFHPSGPSYDPAQVVSRLVTPQPLPPSSNDAAFRTSVVDPASMPTMVDLNGDGYLDIIEIPQGVIGTHGAWTIYPGDSSMTYSDPPYAWRLPYFGAQFDTNYSGWSAPAVLLRDINSDGKPDLVVRSDGQDHTWYAGTLAITAGDLIAFMNTGEGFSYKPHLLARNRPGEAFVTDQAGSTCYNRSVNLFTDGARGYERRMMDINNDGLLDLVRFPVSGTDVSVDLGGTVQYGTGDAFLPVAQTLDPVWTQDGAGKRLLTATGGSCFTNWWLRGDFTDVTGDGVPDLGYYTKTPGYFNGEFFVNAVYRKRAHSYSAQGTPMRLLKSVDNGRGGTTTFSYAPTTDEAVVNNAQMPQVRWVVSEVTVDPGFSAPTITTQYRYGQPIFDNELGRPGEPSRFLGFGSTTTVSPTGASVSRTYNYYTIPGPSGSDVLFDRRGHLASVSTYANENDVRKLVSYQTTSWKTLGLFGGLSVFTFAEERIARTCTNAMDTATCVAQIEDVQRSKTEWTAYNVSGQTVRYYPSMQYSSVDALSYVKGDRRALLGNLFRYGSATGDANDDYRVLPSYNYGQELGDDEVTWSYNNAHATQYDAAGLPSVLVEWRSLYSASFTTVVYDSVGNLTSMTKPEQASTGEKMMLYYGAHKLFLGAATNEAGHLVFTQTDPGTGQTLYTQPWNWFFVPVGPGDWWTYDGFGRATEHYVGVGTSYTKTLVSTTSYDDFAPVQNGNPASVTSRVLQDFGGSIWIEATTRVDGLGRVIDSRAPAPGFSTDLVTSNVYDFAGRLITTLAPDPRVDDGTTVPYSNVYDSLGRVTLSTGPDGNGTQAIYDGFSKTLVEVAADGTGGSKKITVDARGRMAEVREWGPAVPEALTTYEYDNNDNLLRIIDADNNVTELAHDWVGNRETHHQEWPRVEIPVRSQQPPVEKNQAPRKLGDRHRVFHRVPV